MARTPSRTPTPKSFQPQSDAATYRDLLLFEERLKTNASRLRRRKRRYQIFLIHLVFCILILASDATLSTNLVAWPLNHFLRLLDVSPQRDVILPSYITHSAFLVAVTTLVLFYASGLYAEKIGYANRYVPHANRALRSFNMYLNVRTPPISAPWPLHILFRSPTEQTTRSSQHPNSDFARSDRRTTTISPIPPSTNPRGELIFTSRVDKQFRDSYERYRAAFERKRDERVLADATAAASARFWGWFPGSRGKLSASRKEVGMERSDGGGGNRTPSNSRSSTPVGSSKSSGSSPLPRSALRRRRSSSMEGEQRSKSKLDPGPPVVASNEGEECYSFLLGNAEESTPLIGS